VARAEEGEKANIAGINQRQGGLIGEGFSFSGYERDQLMLNLGEGQFLDISGVSGRAFVCVCYGLYVLLSVRVLV